MGALIAHFLPSIARLITRAPSARITALALQQGLIGCAKRAFTRCWADVAGQLQVWSGLPPPATRSAS